MSGPDFIDLVGDDGSEEELRQLRRAHDLLIAAGPPPELSPAIREAPGAITKKTRLPRRRRGAAFLVAAGLVALAFGVGLLVGGRNTDAFSSTHVYAMHPPSGNGLARASVAVGGKDSVGNWPLLLQVSGLKPLPKGDWYELYITRGGKIAGWCGAFNVKGGNSRTTIRMSVPYSLKNAEWVISKSGEGPPQPPWLLTT